MDASLFLARLIGPILVTLGVGLLLNREGYTAMVEELLRSRVFVYLSGVLALTAGIAILLTHHVWVWRWPVIITVIGVLLVIRGIARLILPEQAAAMAKRLLENAPRLLPFTAAAALIAGLALSWFGYFAGTA